jgi:hypothetical protein
MNSPGTENSLRDEKPAYSISVIPVFIDVKAKELYFSHAQVTLKTAFSKDDSIL